MSGIERSFYDLSEKDLELAEQLAHMRRSLFGRSAGWDEVLKSRLILLMSEAQSGKTYECKARQAALWEAGEPAFYVELASVANQPWRDLRSPEETGRLERWRRTGSETATVFLDSVDELALTQGTFRSALRNVANDLDGAMARVKVVLTSRPLPVDRELFLRTFAAPPPAIRISEEDFASLALGEDRNKREKDAPPEVRYVSLLPLSRSDVARIAETRGVTEVDPFLEALVASSMMEFMRRPQDVIEAASAWVELNGSFGTHAEQVAFDIKARLKPNPERNDRDIPIAGALDGAKRLALAVVLTQRLTIRHDVNRDPLDAATAVDPETVLADWSVADRKALLERALFGFASYGRVRFHNRLAFEFLAAWRLSDLIEKGLARSAVRRLIVIETAQGLEVIRPSLRDVAAWLALRQNWVFDLLCRLDPALLMNLGDPGSLALEQKEKVLSAFIDRYGKGGWRGVSVPLVQMHRLSDRGLASIVRAEFGKVENPEVRQVLLDLIGVAQLSDCAEFARAVIWDHEADHYVRADALDALVGLDDRSLLDLAQSVAAGAGLWNHRIARLIIYRLFPKHMSVDQLLATLSWVKETRSTGSELSKVLPTLIDGLDVQNLEKLCAGLGSLIEPGFVWNEHLHAAKNDRPHLVHPLAAACAKLLEAEPRSADPHAIALAAILGRGMRSDDAIPAALAQAVASAPVTIRAAIFDESVALFRRLRPDRDRLDLFGELVWRGVAAPTQADDVWLRDRLREGASTPDVRAAALLVHVLGLARESEEPRDYLKLVADLVADDPDLATYISRHMQPRQTTRDQRRWEICNKRRKRQRERRSAKARASWILFWRELTSDTSSAFAPDKIESTAYDLWRVMQRSEAARRSSGWDRRMIADHLGDEVAENLQKALAPIWRREAVPLPSEREPDERDRSYRRWTVALAGIAAEAEDPKWVQSLSVEEVEKAVRYAPEAMNGFPPWLEDLAERHGDIVERLLGAELSWILAGAVPEQGFSIMLQNIDMAPPRVARLFVPRLRSWLAATRGVPKPEDNIEGAAARLQQVLEILLKLGDDTDRAEIARLAEAALARGSSEAVTKLWLSTLFSVDPSSAVSRFEAMCEAIPVGRDSKAVRWFSDLFGRSQRRMGVNLKQPGFSPDLLLRLVRLSYRHVQMAEDAVHEGSFSPDTRDDAETARSALLTAIIELGGPEGWAAKQEIANDPLFTHFRDRMHALAVEKSASEADSVAMAPEEVAKLDVRHEPSPRSGAEMFALMRDRLEDLQDYLKGDSSPRSLWSTIRDEYVMRQAIAGRLEERALGAYAVGQEGVTAEGKETDVRLRSTAGAIEGVIELKIGDKQNYSGRSLRETISQQLVSKYLAPEARRAGCLLVTRSSRERWEHPDTGEMLDFGALIGMLSEAAREIQEKFPDEIHLSVVGLDLKPRLPTERAARKPRAKSRSRRAAEGLSDEG